jgi:hypothetical protein
MNLFEVRDYLALSLHEQSHLFASVDLPHLPQPTSRIVGAERLEVVDVFLLLLASNRRLNPIPEGTERRRKRFRGRGTGEPHVEVS